MKDKNLDQLVSTLQATNQNIPHGGTIMLIPAKPLKFKDSKKSPVKELGVNIFSAESTDFAVLHGLHTKTRIIKE